MTTSPRFTFPGAKKEARWRPSRGESFSLLLDQLSSLASDILILETVPEFFFLLFLDYRGHRYRRREHIRIQTSLGSSHVECDGPSSSDFKCPVRARNRHFFLKLIYLTKREGSGWDVSPCLPSFHLLDLVGAEWGSNCRHWHGRGFGDSYWSLLLSYVVISDYQA